MGAALRVGLAAVNVVQTAHNAVQAITNAPLATNPVGRVVIAIATLAAGFVLAYNTLKPFHDAVNTAFVLLKARVTVAGGIVERIDVALNSVLDMHHDFDAANQVLGQIYDVAGNVISDASRFAIYIVA